MRRRNVLEFLPALTPGGELLVNVGKVFEETDFFGAMLNTCSRRATN